MKMTAEQKRQRERERQTDAYILQRKKVLLRALFDAAQIVGTCYRGEREKRFVTLTFEIFNLMSAVLNSCLRNPTPAQQASDSAKRTIEKYLSIVYLP